MVLSGRASLPGEESSPVVETKTVRSAGGATAPGDGGLAATSGGDAVGAGAGAVQPIATTDAMTSATADRRTLPIGGGESR